MARIEVPIPAKDKDYDSRKSRAQLINLMVQTNKDGSFKSIKKREGVSLVGQTTAGDVVCSNFSPTYQVSTPQAYFCGELNLYSIATSGVITNLGAHGLSNADFGVSLAQNTTIGGGPITEPQTLGVESAPPHDGFVYTNVGVTAIVDPDFVGKDPDYVTFLSGRFWFSDRSTDEFFGSDIGDGLTYDPLTFGSTDEISGEITAVKGIRSNLWAFSTSHCEYWQGFDDPTFPLRRVKGASIMTGMSDAGLSAALGGVIDQIDESIAYLASDYTVRLIQGSTSTIISDYDFSLKIEQDDGFLYPLMSAIDGADHKYFVLTSYDQVGNSIEEVKDFTWIYDLSTGQSHYRTSPGKNHWDMYKAIYMANVAFSAVTQAPIYMMSNEFSALVGPNGFRDSNIYRLDPNVYDDLGVDFECILQTASLSFDEDVSVKYIEVEMETGVGNVDSPDPEMTVEYSKDGGANFITWGAVELGGSTDQSNRIRMNSFGRLVKHRDFILRLTIEEPVKIEIYGIYAEVEDSF